MTRNTFFDDKIVLFDFDSTMVKGEGLDLIAAHALAALPEAQRQQVLAEIVATTQLGMEGKIGFAESLQGRMHTLRHLIHRQMVHQVAEQCMQEISTFFLLNYAFFDHKAEDTFIISGGFEEVIQPTAQLLGIPKRHILANRFLFDQNGLVIDFDHSRLAAQDQGKVKQVAQLELDPNRVVMIGDGSTDRMVKEAGLARYFFAFTENVDRPGILHSKEGQLVADGTQRELGILIRRYLQVQEETRELRWETAGWLGHPRRQTAGRLG